LVFLDGALGGVFLPRLAFAVLAAPVRRGLVIARFDTFRDLTRELLPFRVAMCARENGKRAS
jgi:hypothetical protein